MTVNVHDFGAADDGEHDDTAAFQAAIDAAAMETLPPDVVEALEGRLRGVAAETARRNARMLAIGTPGPAGEGIYETQRLPSRIGVGDESGAPCRIFGMDIDGPLISGVRESDGTFTLDRVSLPAAPSPYDAFRHLRFEFEVPTFPAGQSFAERMAALIECYGLAPTPPLASPPTTMADLAEAVAQQRRLVDAQTVGEIAVGDPRVLGTDELLEYFAQVRPASHFVVDAPPEPARPVEDPELEAAKHWPAQGNVCAHVCGPDPGHVCDARAVTHLRHQLPSGGTRELPLCGPCADAEGVPATRGAPTPAATPSAPAASGPRMLSCWSDPVPVGSWADESQPPVDRLFVIAATRVQFTEWCREVGISPRNRRVVHVTDYRQLRGAPHGLRYLVLDWPTGPGFAAVAIRDALRSRDALGVSGAEYEAWRASVATVSGEHDG